MTLGAPLGSNSARSVWSSSPAPSSAPAITIASGAPSATSTRTDRKYRMIAKATARITRSAELTMS